MTDFVECRHPDVDATAVLPRSALAVMTGWVPIEAAVDHPPKNAQKSVWVDYAVTKGGLAREDAEQMTRDDIVAHFTKES